MLLVVIGLLVAFVAAFLAARRLQLIEPVVRGTASSFEVKEEATDKYNDIHLTLSVQRTT
jgi:hypothetical protein